MLKIADILLFMGLSIVVVYFLFSILFPLNYRKRTKKQLLLILLIPIVLISLSFTGYYVKNRILFKHSLPKTYGVVEANLDSLNNELTLDTISFAKINTIVNELLQNKEEIEKIIEEQEALQKRVRINQFNKKLSDSIMNRIQSILNNIEIKRNYSIENKLVTHSGKVLRYNGKIVTHNETVFNDLYAIDSVEFLPIVKEFDFKSNTYLKELNYYIDSVEIQFRLKRNTGRIRNSNPDSIMFITITPIYDSYPDYHYFNNQDNERIAYLDSTFFDEQTTYSVRLDFPNTGKQDSIVCFDFHLKRGLIGSYCVSFNR